MKIIRALEFKDGKLFFINQTKLPLEEEIVSTDDYERVAFAIERLEVRGAPAIGVAAAYGLALSIKNVLAPDQEKIFEKAFERIAATRPTAVNLFYALHEIKKIFEQGKGATDRYESLLDKARTIHEDDIKLCDMIANNGLQVFNKRSRVLTHCNAGALATSGNGTAVNVIRKAFENDLVEFVYADETRPLLQGSRLTAWELDKYGIPFSINTDSAAAFLMQRKKIDLVIVGADRISANGDTANKIGTYNLAVLCKHHNIPFYIAAPSTSIDQHCSDGTCITIEERNNLELTRIGDSQITRNEYPAYCPAFDVTPHNLITAIITEKKVYKPMYNFSHVRNN